MNLYFKFAFLILKRIFLKRRQGLTDSCVSKFRVSFLDLDLNFHMNNGRYFSVMDLGRFDMMIRTGHFFRLFKSGYFPVVLSESMIFKKSLGLWKAYEVHTKVDGWDKDFFYMTQQFVVAGKVVSSGHVRACFIKRGRKGIVGTSEMFEFIGETHPEIHMTDLAKKHIEMDKTLLPRKSVQQ